MTATITVMPKELPVGVTVKRVHINVNDLLSQKEEYTYSKRRMYHPNILDDEGHIIWVDNPEGKVNKYTGKVEQDILKDKTKISIGVRETSFKDLMEYRINELLMTKFNPLDTKIMGFTIDIQLSALVAKESTYKDEITEIVTYDSNARDYAPFHDEQHRSVMKKTPNP
jgi:hypothetical protein